MTVFSVDGYGKQLSTADDVEKFCKEVAACEDLREIRLSGNSWAPEAVAAFAEALKSKKQLTYALMSDIFTGRLKDTIAKSLDYFTDALVDKSLLTYIDLSDNAFGPIGAKALVRLPSENRSLETIRLNNNGLGPQGGRFIAEALTMAHEANVRAGTPSRLRSLVIGRTRLENGSAPLIAEALSLHGTLVEVGMPQNGIRPEGVAKVLSHLTRCTGLEILDMQDNTFTFSGAQALANALPSWPNLVKLNVGDCLLSAEGCCAVLNAIDDAHLALSYLNMQYDEMDEEGALLCASIVPRLESLVALTLNGNCFSAKGEGAAAIREALGADREDVLDSLSDMEVSDDESSDESSSEVGSAALVEAFEKTLRVSE